MTKITSEKLVELIEKSQLAKPEEIQQLTAKIRSELGGKLPDDPVELTKKFEDANLITRWQSEKLMLGKYKGYFLGKHKLLGHIGRGGMSSVYLATHTGMNTLRAIKVLPKSKMSKSSYLERFRREAKAIASLNHPNIVRAYDIDNDKDTHYIVMEYIDGLDLQNLVKKKGPLPYERVAEYIALTASGLQHAHDAGLIHRDVKPANILISTKGEVKLLDLGLALFADDTLASLTVDYNDKVLGTADYLAPEQALNSHKVDPKADMYGLGCTMYFALTGHAPFPDGSIAERIAKHQTIMPDDIRKDRSDIPGELEGICVKMIQKDPRFRYVDCAEVHDVLMAWLAKYRETLKARKRVGVGGGDSGASSSSVDLESSNAFPRPSDAETVSNRAQDTLNGNPLSGASVVSLSTSDSGVLRKIASRDSQSDSGSAIDLQEEAAKRRAANKQNRRKSQSNPTVKTPLGKASDTIRNKAVAASTTTVKQVANHPRVPVWLLILSLICMFAFAIGVGIGIERVIQSGGNSASPEPSPNSDSETEKSSD